MRELAYGPAIREALAQSMAADPSVFVFGEGVDDPGGIFGSTRGLAEEYGADRCFDTPLAEEALTGIANGAALCGMRPVFVHARVEFALLTMNQLLTHSAKWKAMYGPENAMPVVIRTVIGRGWGQGAQHSQSLQALFMSTPGLRVAMPARASDAKGLLCSALQGSDPVIFLEHRQLYDEIDDVPEERYELPFGRARIARPGDDVTIIAMSQMVGEAERAADALADEGISAEILDPRSLVPLDHEAIVESVSRTGRALVVDNGWTRCGASAEITSVIAEECFDALRAPVRRVGFPLLATPSSHVLEHAYYPNWETIAAGCQALMDRAPRPRLERRDEKSLTQSW